MSRMKDMISKTEDRNFERAIKMMEFKYATQIRVKQKAVRGRR